MASSSLLLFPVPPPDTDAVTPKPTSIRGRLSQLCKDGRLDHARRLFDSLPVPVPTLLWNTLVIGHNRNSMPLQALAIYAQMNAPPDHYTFSSALKACADARLLRHGQSVHCHMLRRLAAKPKNLVLHNSLLGMYASCLPQPQAAKTLEILFRRMPKRNAVSYNILVAWYARNSRFLTALERFLTMLTAGIKPTIISFVNVFPAIAGIGERRIANATYAFATKLGDGFISNLFVVSSAIAMYSDLCDVKSARQVFDSARAKNSEVWNSMIAGYVQNELPEEAIDLFVQMDAPVDAVTLLQLLMAASWLQGLQFARQIHGFIVRSCSSVTLPVILLNALIVMYSRCGSINDALVVFNQMEERNIVSWNTMISALVQNGMNMDALLLFHQMQQKGGFGVDSVTAIALLSASSNLGDIRIGKQTHAYLFRHGIECPGMKCYLIDMYSKGGHVGTARKLFDMDQYGEKDQVTWNMMISVYSQSGQTDEAISILRLMLEDNLGPDSVTVASILPACDPIGGIKMGKELHAYALRHSVDVNVFVGTALIGMYSKCGKISYAESVFGGMRERNSVTYTTMILGYGQHGMGDRALSLFRMMLDMGMKPNGATFIAIMSACSYTGLVEEGLEIFQSMDRVYGIPATPEHHCCIVDLLGRAGRVEEAYELALELGDDTLGIWGSLLAACKIHGKFELGNVVAERLLAMEKDGKHAGYHVLLSNVYAAQRKWGSVDKMRKHMREMGLAKEPGSSWIELGDTTRRFVSKDQGHPEHDQMHGILYDLVAEMKLCGYKPKVDDCFEDELELLE